MRKQKTAERDVKNQMSILVFILGLAAGGALALFLVGALSARRILQYEVINTKLHQQNKRLADSLPEESRKYIPGVDRCVCCGKEIPEGQMVCGKCLRDSM